MKNNKITKKSVLREIEENKDKIKMCGVKKIGLFGSIAKGEQNKKSDLDIIVSFDNISFGNYFGLLRTLEKIFKRKIDLVVESDLKPELKYIKKEALYAEI